MQERLSAVKLRELGEKLGAYLGCAPWAKTAGWQPFMSDVSTLASGMEKLAEVMTKDAAAKKAQRKKSEAPRAPDREEDVEGSGLKEPCPPEAVCDAMYAVLRARLGNLDDYKPLALDDGIMGIDLTSSRNIKSRAREAFRSNLAIPETAVYLHVYHSGGPRPHTLHVWKVPAEVAQRSEAKQASTLSQVVAQAPQQATRQMKVKWMRTTAMPPPQMSSRMVLTAPQHFIRKRD